MDVNLNKKEQDQNKKDLLSLIVVKLRLFRKHDNKNCMN